MANKGVNMDQLNKVKGSGTECVFCQIVSSPNENHTYGIVPVNILKNLIVTSTSNFYVMLDIAPLANNHSLIVTKQHYPAFSYVAANNWGEVLDLIDLVSSAIVEATGVFPSIFEHGVVSKNDKFTCCIDHAHIHVVPIDIDVTNVIEKDGFDLLGIGEYDKFAHSLKGIPYLFYKAPKRTGRFYTGKNIPSQYIRKILADALGLELWLWQDVTTLINPELQKTRLVRSYQTISKLLPHCHSFMTR